MANLSDGWRRRTFKGATVQSTTKIIDNLPIGTYRWVVQAIDTALAGSPFTKIGTFSITSNVAEYIIAGRVMNPSGQGIPNARIKEGNAVLAITDSNGFYCFAKSPGWSTSSNKPIKPFILATPTGEYTINPASRNYTNLSTHKINQDFIVTHKSVIHDHSSTN